MKFKFFEKFNYRALLVSGIFAISISVILFFMNANSPFYLFTSDGDTNVYMLVSKQMQSGKLIYRDVFDHKGPIWYFIFDFFYTLTGTHYFLYFAQILSGFIFFVYSCKIFNLLTERVSVFNYITMAVCCGTVYLSAIILNGECPDKFSLPIASYFVYLIVRYAKTNVPIRWYQYFFVGLHIGILFWSKFTLLWFYFAMFVFLIYAKCPRFLIGLCMTFVGACAVSLLVLLYFWQNNALSDLINVYFYANLFEYGDDSSNFVARLFQNASVIFSAYGVFWLLLLCIIIFVMVFCSSNKSVFDILRKYIILLFCAGSMFVVFLCCKVSNTYYYSQFFSVLPVLVYVFDYCLRSDEHCRDKMIALRRSVKAKVILISVFVIVVLAQIYLLYHTLYFFATPNIFDTNLRDRMCYKVTDYIKSNPSYPVKVVGWDGGYQQLLDFNYYPKDEYYVAIVNIRANEIDDLIRSSVCDHEYGYIVLVDWRMDIWEHDAKFFEMNGYKLVMSGVDNYVKVGLFEY